MQLGRELASHITRPSRRGLLKRADIRLTPNCIQAERWRCRCVCVSAHLLSITANPLTAASSTCSGHALNACTDRWQCRSLIDPDPPLAPCRWEIVSRGPGHHAKDSSVQYEDTCFGHVLNTLADWLPAERPTDATSRQLPQQSWFDDSDDFGYPGFSGHCETALASQSRWGAGGTGSHGFPGLVRSTTPVPQVWGACVEAGLPLPTIAECRESVAGAWLQHFGNGMWEGAPRDWGVPQVWAVSVEAGLPLPTIMECR